MDVLSDIVEDFDENAPPPQPPAAPTPSVVENKNQGFPAAQHRSKQPSLSLGKTDSQHHAPQVLQASGAPSGGGLLDVSAIDADAKRRVADMTEEQKQEWLSDISTLLSPEFVDSLKKGGLKKFHKGAGAVEEKAPEHSKQASEGFKGEGSFMADKETISKALAAVESEEDLRQVSAQYLSESEKAKLEWTTPINKPSTASSSATLTPRFTLEGLPVDGQHEFEDTTLYHHGDEPERPGYTMEELLHLSRSAVSSQRSIALKAIFGVLEARRQAMCAGKTPLPEELPLYLPVSLRAALDDPNPSVLLPALRGIAAYVACPTDEEHRSAAGNLDMEDGLKAWPAPIAPQSTEKDLRDPSSPLVSSNTPTGDASAPDAVPKHSDAIARQLEYTESGAFLEDGEAIDDEALVSNAEYDAQQCVYDAVHGFHRMRILDRLEYLVMLGSMSPEAIVHVCTIVRAFARRSLHHAWKVMSHRPLLNFLTSIAEGSTYMTASLPKRKIQLLQPLASSTLRLKAAIQAVQCLSALAVNGRVLARQLSETNVIGSLKRFVMVPEFEEGVELRNAHEEALMQDLRVQVFRLWQVLLSYGMDINAVADVYRHVGEAWLQDDRLCIELARLVARLIHIAHEGITEHQDTRKEASAEEGKAQASMSLSGASVAVCRHIATLWPHVARKCFQWLLKGAAADAPPFAVRCAVTAAWTLSAYMEAATALLRSQGSSRMAAPTQVPDSDTAALKAFVSTPLDALSAASVAPLSYVLATRVLAPLGTALARGTAPPVARVPLLLECSLRFLQAQEALAVAMPAAPVQLPQELLSQLKRYCVGKALPAFLSPTGALDVPVLRDAVLHGLGSCVPACLDAVATLPVGARLRAAVLTVPHALYSHTPALRFLATLLAGVSTRPSYEGAYCGIGGTRIVPAVALYLLERLGPGHEALAVSLLDTLLQPRTLVLLMSMRQPDVKAEALRNTEESLLPWLLAVRSALVQVYTKLMENYEGDAEFAASVAQASPSYLPTLRLSRSMLLPALSFDASQEAQRPRPSVPCLLQPPPSTATPLPCTGLPLPQSCRWAVEPLLWVMHMQPEALNDPTMTTDWGSTTWALAAFASILFTAVHRVPLLPSDAAGDAGLRLLPSSAAPTGIAVSPAAWAHFFLRAVCVGTASPHLLLLPHLLPAHAYALRLSMQHCMDYWQQGFGAGGVLSPLLHGDAQERAGAAAEEAKGAEAADLEAAQALELPSWARGSWLQAPGAVSQPREEALGCWGWLEACEGKAVADSAAHAVWDQFVSASYGHALSAACGLCCLLPGVSDKLSKQMWTSLRENGMARHFTALHNSYAAALAAWRSEGKAIDGIMPHLAQSAPQDGLPPLSLAWWMDNAPWHVTDAAGDLLVKGKQVGWQVADARDGRVQDPKAVVEEQGTLLYCMCLWFLAAALGVKTATTAVEDGAAAPQGLSHKAVALLVRVLQHAPAPVAFHACTVCPVKEPSQAQHATECVEFNSYREYEAATVQGTSTPQVPMPPQVRWLLQCVAILKTSSAGALPPLLKPFEDACRAILQRFEKDAVLSKLLGTQ